MKNANLNRIGIAAKLACGCAVSLAIASCAMRSPNTSPGTTQARAAPAPPLLQPVPQTKAPLPWQSAEYYPGYPPEQYRATLFTPAELPGAKLGYSKEKSAAVLSPEVRELLDIARRFYFDPTLLARRSELLRSLQVSSIKRTTFITRMPDGTEKDSFREDVTGGRLLGKPAWRGNFYYRGFDSIERTRWSGELALHFDEEGGCVDSRAVEGYLDVPLDPQLLGVENILHPRRSHDRKLGRHAPDGAGGPKARSPANRMASIRVGIVHGCLSELNLNSYFNLNEVSNEHVYDK